MKGKKEIRHYTVAEKMAEDYKISQCYVCYYDYRSCPYFETVLDKINDSVSKKSIRTYLPQLLKAQEKE